MTNDLSSLLKDWGSLMGLLAIAATSLTIILMISLREFALWFLNINQIVQNQRLLMTKLESLEKAVAEKTEAPTVFTPELKTVNAKFPLSSSEETEDKVLPLIN